MNGTLQEESGSTSAAGAIEQTFGTDLNATYVVQFYLSANPGCGVPQTMTLGVSATPSGAASQSFESTAVSTNVDDMTWTPESYSFVAEGIPTTLTFAADPLNTSNCGPVLGDVTVTETAATGAMCKDGGWKSMFEPSGAPFTNQGDCVSYYAISGATPIGS